MKNLFTNILSFIQCVYNITNGVQNKILPGYKK